MGLIDRLRRCSPQSLVTGALVGVAVTVTLVQLQPALLLTNTTPSGGDMGAHVWGPAFLRDHLLPEGRLSGWAPDWYAGFPAYQFYMVVPSLLIVALDVVLPYNIAFKLVSVSGLLALPVAAWALGRLCRLPFPGPALLAVATVAFIFDRSFSIYGGNAYSTLAGEFAFSISLALAVVFVGLVLRGLETGRHRVSAALVFALCALCHIIPAIFAVGAVALALVLRPSRRRVRWLGSVGLVGALLGAFWTLPFVARRAYLNDMGWEKLTTYWEALLPGRLGSAFSRAFGGQANATVPGDLTWVVILAVAGVGASIAFRRRLGRFLGLLAPVIGAAFVLAPQGRLWNARLLPFWYLCLYLLAAIAVAELITQLGVVFARGKGQPRAAVVLGLPVAATLVVLVVVGLPLRALPFGQTSPDGSTYSWAGISTTDRSNVADWARWNYSGYEGKAAYPEYRAILDTMGEVGDTRGCGRAMWEYDNGLDRFGTPMALMLLPYFTDGCIGSMEGLFFEASATTPYHFLNQSELSVAPSRAQRDLPYGDLDVGAGVDHLQLLGVRYYMAFSPQAVSQANAEPDLSLVATTGTWRVYEVADAQPIQPLTAEPAVLTDVPEGGRGWLEPAVAWYLDPSAQRVFLAASGPSSWPRVSVGERPPVRAVPATKVTRISVGTDNISFDVDRPGTPVLVKASYFPNWKVSGAEGPWRVAPNLMVVVPTTNQVELTYGTTGVEQVAWLATLLGVAGLVVLARHGRLAMATRRRFSAWTTDGSGGPPALVLDVDPDDDLDGREASPLVTAVDGPLDAGLDDLDDPTLDDLDDLDGSDRLIDDAVSDGSPERSGLPAAVGAPRANAGQPERIWGPAPSTNTDPSGPESERGPGRHGGSLP